MKRLRLAWGRAVHLAYDFGGEADLAVVLTDGETHQEIPVSPRGVWILVHDWGRFGPPARGGSRLLALMLPDGGAVGIEVVRAPGD